MRGFASVTSSIHPAHCLNYSAAAMMLGADGRAEDLGLGGAREPRPSITRTNFACTNTRTFGLDACHAMLVGPGPDAPREWSDGPSRLGRTCSLQNHLCYHLFVLWPFREFVFFFIIKKKVFRRTTQQKGELDRTQVILGDLFPRAGAVSLLSFGLRVPYGCRLW